jgi:hypothetical protein
MKRHAYPELRLLVVASLVVLQFSTFAQDSTQLQVISPFDSVSLNEVKAIGNLETGSVEVTMQVQSEYHKLASINFGGAGFGDFGLTDDKGVKYKYSSYDGPPGNSYGVNKGYSRITDLLLGKKKVLILIAVQDTFHTGQSETLKFRLVKVDTTVRTIKEAHLLCTLMLDYMMAGQKQYYIKNIPVEWLKSKPKAAGKG